MLDKTALTLTIIGALNWGSIGLFRFDIVAWIFGGQTAILSRIVYTLIALAGVWCLSLLFRNEGDTVETMEKQQGFQKPHGKKRPPIQAGVRKTVKPTYVAIIGRFLYYVLVRQRLGLPLTQGRLWCAAKRSPHDTPKVYRSAPLRLFDKLEFDILLITNFFNNVFN